MKTIKKALAKLSEQSINLELKDINVYIPINRVLDEVGFYILDKVSSPTHTYVLTILNEEVHTQKTKVLFSKIGKNTAFDPITEEDLEDIKLLALNLMFPQDLKFFQ